MHEYCREPGCGLPVEPEGEPFTMNGWRLEGQILVTFQWFRCVANHIYQAEISEVIL